RDRGDDRGAADAGGDHRPARHPARRPALDHALARRRHRPAGRGRVPDRAQLTMPTVAWIAMTPVKGLRLHDVEAVELGVKGIAGDRAFFLADDSGRMVSGTRLGPLVAVVAEHDAAAGTLSLRLPDGRVVADEVELEAPEQVGFFGLTLDARPVAR